MPVKYVCAVTVLSVSFAIDTPVSLDTVLAVVMFLATTEKDMKLKELTSIKNQTVDVGSITVVGYLCE